MSHHALTASIRDTLQRHAHAAKYGAAALRIEVLREHTDLAFWWAKTFDELYHDTRTHAVTERTRIAMHRFKNDSHTTRYIADQKHAWMYEHVMHEKWGEVGCARARVRLLVSKEIAEPTYFRRGNGIVQMVGKPENYEGNATAMQSFPTKIVNCDERALVVDLSPAARQWRLVFTKMMVGERKVKTCKQTRRTTFSYEHGDDVFRLRLEYAPRDTAEYALDELADAATAVLQHALSFVGASEDEIRQSLDADYEQFSRSPEAVSSPWDEFSEAVTQ